MQGGLKNPLQRRILAAQEQGIFRMISRFRALRSIVFGGLMMLAGLLPSALGAEAVALVIGNDDYAHVAKLKMARQDSRGYVALFEARGFRTFHLEDADGAAMRLALARFYDSISPGDTVAFVYAGHGWSNGTNNYLLPTDVADSGSQSVIEAQSFDLRNGVNGIVDEIARRGAGFTLAVIDACRDNPFRSENGTRALGVTRGLARVSAPQGMFIAFSAGEGQTALDRLGNEGEQYSVFTRHFLRELARPQDVQSAFKATQLAVNRDAQSVGHSQRPAYYDEVIGQVCLPPGCAAGVQVAALPASPPGSPAPARAVPDAAQEWADFRNSNSIAALELFAARHDGSPYAALARERIRVIQASNAPARPQVIPQGFARPDWCPNAETRTELAICTDRALSGFDILLNRVYKTRLLELGGAERRELEARQKRWLASRDLCGGNVDCLKRQYQAQLQLISG